MAEALWFEAHATMAKHPKTLKLARLLGVKRREAVGLLHDLFAWGLTSAEKHGDLSGLTALDIGQALDYGPKKAETVVSALVEAGYLEWEGDSYRLHDWYDYAGKLYDGRGKNRLKDKGYRDRRKSENDG